MLQAVDKEVELEYLHTMIIAKSATLDRENAQDVQKYNKLIEDYHSKLFVRGTAKVKEKDQIQIDKLMDNFKKNFRNKDITGLKKSKSKISNEDFSDVNIKTLGAYIKEIE